MPDDDCGWAQRFKVGDGQSMKPQAGQLDLFDPDPGRPRAGRPRKPRKPPLDRRYREWLAEHGETFRLFERLAWQLRKAGHARIGGKAIAEGMRWTMLLAGPDGDGDDAYKIPNQYVSRMVRDLIGRDPSWAAYFETRRLQS